MASNSSTLVINLSTFFKRTTEKLMRKVNDSPILHKIFMSYSTQNLKTVNLLVFMILNFLNEYLESNFNLSFSTKGSQKPIKEGFGY